MQAIYSFKYTLSNNKMQAIARGLEKILGEEGFGKLKDCRLSGIKLYDTGIDAFSLNTFSYYVAFIFEKLLAGMSWKRHLFTRGIALVTNTSTARIYENIRTRAFKRLNIDETTPVKKYLADTVLFMGLQMPLHWANMCLGTLLEKGKIEKEDVMQMAVASFSMIPIAGLLGGPYGLYRDSIRKSAGLPIEYARNQKL